MQVTFVTIRYRSRHAMLCSSDVPDDFIAVLSNPLDARLLRVRVPELYDILQNLNNILRVQVFQLMLEVHGAGILQIRTVVLMVAAYDSEYVIRVDLEVNTSCA